MDTLLLINGPNLGILGKRKPEIYGSVSLREIETTLSHACLKHNIELKSFQNNTEGKIIDFLESNYDSLGAIINPGALMMSGWAFRDALENYPKPWIEVHISNIFARESFRHHSILTDLSTGLISGFGTDGYNLALHFFTDQIHS